MSYIKKISALGLTLIMTVSVIPMTSLAANYGWVQKSDGKWYYYDYYGKKVKYDSREDFDTETGTYKYYVLNSKGARVTSKGWYTTKYRITEYYNKIKFTNKYYLKSDGSCTTGWKKIGKKYYYFYDDGKMATSTSIRSKDGTKLYLVGNDGARITKKGWYQVTYKDFDDSDGDIYTRKEWYYVKTDKTVATKIKKIGKKKYLFGSSGALICNDYASFYNESKDTYTYYCADKNGVLITKKGVHKFTGSEKYKGSYYSGKDTWNFKVYVGSDGKLVTGLKKIKGKMYYFNPTMRRNGSYTDYDTNTTYFFGKSGACTKTYKSGTT